MRRPGPMQVSPWWSLGAGAVAAGFTVALGIAFVALWPSTPEADRAVGRALGNLALFTGGGVAVGVQLIRTRPRWLGALIFAAALTLGLLGSVLLSVGR